MYEQLTLDICPNANATVSAFHAKVSVLLESGAVSQILEALSFLKSCGWLKNDTLNYYSRKMYGDCSTMMGGATFGTIIRTMDELGYDVEWQLLNSKHYGVPQNRERVFIIGHLRREPTPKVFPIIKDGGTFDGVQRCENDRSVLAGTLDTRIDGQTRGTYPTDKGGGYSK